MDIEIEGPIPNAKRSVPTPPTPITVILGVNSCILSGIAMLSIIVSYKKVKSFIISDFFFDLIELMKIIVNIKFL